jgi:hypothetical protein
VQEITVDGDVVFSSETAGQSYAASYLATTGGNLFTANGGGNLDNTIDNMNDGDALVLGAGSYTGDFNIFVDSNNTPDHLRNKDVLVCGGSAEVNDVSLFLDGLGRQGRDAHFSTLNNSQTPNAQYAFLRLIVDTPGRTASYAHAIFAGPNRGSFPGSGLFTNFVNCVLDMDNYFDAPAWEYNNAGVDKGMKFIRCTFANYTGFRDYYSEGPGSIDLEDNIFEDVRALYGDGTINETNTAQNVSIGSNFSYDTTLHPDRGHLYVPNTNAIF